MTSTPGYQMVVRIRRVGGFQREAGAWDVA
jgi:hypothetical protein